MKLEIRFAEAADIPEILAIAGEGGLSARSAPDYVAEVERDDSLFLVASETVNCEIVGFVVGRLISTHNNAAFDAEIHNIGVSKAFLRKGVGTLLFAQFLKTCRRRKVVDLWLEVRSKNNVATEFYRGFGFRTKFVRKGYYRDPVDDANVMSTNL